METNFDFGVMKLKPYKKPMIVTNVEKSDGVVPLAIIGGLTVAEAAVGAAAAVGVGFGLAKGVVDVIHLNEIRKINSKI